MSGSLAVALCSPAAQVIRHHDLPAPRREARQLGVGGPPSSAVLRRGFGEGVSGGTRQRRTPAIGWISRLVVRIHRYRLPRVVRRTAFAGRGALTHPTSSLPATAGSARRTADWKALRLGQPVLLPEQGQVTPGGVSSVCTPRQSGTWIAVRWALSGWWEQTALQLRHRDKDQASQAVAANG